MTDEQKRVAREAIANALAYGTGIVSTVQEQMDLNDLPRLTIKQINQDLLALAQEQERWTQ